MRVSAFRIGLRPIALLNFTKTYTDSKVLGIRGQLSALLGTVLLLVMQNQNVILDMDPNGPR